MEEEKINKNTKNDNRKLLLGLVVIIGIMALSYVLFPTNRDVGDRGFDFGREIQKLEKDISNIDFLPLPATTTDATTSTVVATSTDFFDFKINGPGGCSTVKQCEEYCSVPENLEECEEYFGEF